MVGWWEVPRVSTLLGERGEKETRVDDEVDIGQVVSAGGWGNEERLSGHTESDNHGAGGVGQACQEMRGQRDSREEDKVKRRVSVRESD